MLRAVIQHSCVLVLGLIDIPHLHNDVSSHNIASIHRDHAQKEDIIMMQEVGNEIVQSFPIGRFVDVLKTKELFDEMNFILFPT